MSWLNVAQFGWISHPALLFVEATATSVVLAFLDKRPARERLYYGIYQFGCFAAATFAGGWIMHLIHG